MTGSIRLFVEDALGEGVRVVPTPAQAHYLGGVMRRGVGDAVVLFNGRDGEWAARIEAIRRERAVLAVGALLRGQAAGPDLWLAFAVLKRDATDLVVQKATELGVSRIVPVMTERTQGGRMNLERLRAIAVEAAEQSERLDVPELVAPLRLAELLGGWPAGRGLVVALERGGGAAITPMHGPSALLVGPEGGFAPREVELLRRTPFLQAVHLGPRILRAETAAIVGLALLQAGVGG